MFLLALVEDKLKITPENFDKDSTQSLIDQIDLKYANKILLDVGLCICFYDFEEVGDPYVYPAEGACHQYVKFRMMVFKPFAGEVMNGKIVQVSSEGLQISLGFFSDILIPSHLLQQPSEFSYTTNSWVWRYNAASDETSDSDFTLSVGDTVRFRVRSLTFNKGRSARTADQPPGVASDVAPAVEGDATRRNATNKVSEPDLPFIQIVGCINEDGLGNIVWWSS